MGATLQWPPLPPAKERSLPRSATTRSSLVCLCVRGLAGLWTKGICLFVRWLMELCDQKRLFLFFIFGFGTSSPYGVFVVRVRDGNASWLFAAEQKGRWFRIPMSGGRWGKTERGERTRR